MKRIAAPMIGGVVTSAILELLLYPTIYMLWRRRHLPNPNGPDASAPVPDMEVGTGGKRPHRFPWLLLLAVAAASGGYVLWQHARGPAPALAGPGSGAPFATRSANGLTINFYHPGGGLRLTGNDVIIEFQDTASGVPVDVGTVKFALDMNMPGMVMHSGGTITSAGGVGRYQAKIKPDMAGDWTAKLDYEGPRGQGSVSFTVNVAQ